jgi:hypothetical protein
MGGAAANRRHDAGGSREAGDVGGAGVGTQENYRVGAGGQPLGARGVKGGATLGREVNRGTVDIMGASAGAWRALMGTFARSLAASPSAIREGTRMSVWPSCSMILDFILTPPITGCQRTMASAHDAIIALNHSSNRHDSGDTLREFLKVPWLFGRTDRSHAPGSSTALPRAGLALAHSRTPRSIKTHCGSKGLWRLCGRELAAAPCI